MNFDPTTTSGTTSNQQLQTFLQSIMALASKNNQQAGGLGLNPATEQITPSNSMNGSMSNLNALSQMMGYDNNSMFGLHPQQNPQNATGQGTGGPLAGGPGPTPQQTGQNPNTANSANAQQQSDLWSGLWSMFGSAAAS